MDKYPECLKECHFFRNINEDAINAFLSEKNYKIKKFIKDEIIAHEDDICESLGIVTDGKISAQRIYPTGKTITVNMFGKADIFGEAVIFSSNGRYPATFIAKSDSEIMFIPRKEIIRLCFCDQVYLGNFLSALSDRILLLNKKLKTISFQTVRQKVVNYILEEYNIQKSLSITLPMSRVHLAEYLDIPRPSLSRELARLRDEKVLDFYKNSIKVIDLDALESFLF